MFGFKGLLRGNSLQRKIALSYSVLILVFIILTITITNLYSSRILESATLTYAKEALAKMMDSIDYVLKDADLMSINIIMDREINDYLSKEIEQGTFEDMKRAHIIKDKLKRAYKNSYSFNAEICLLTDHVYINTYDNLSREVMEGFDWYQAAQAGNERLTFSGVHNTGYVQSSITGSIALIRKYGKLSGRNINNGTIIVDLDIKDLKKTIRSKRVDGNAETYLLDKKGEIILKTGGKEDLDAIIQGEYFKSMVNSNEGVISPEGSHEKSIILYYTSSLSGWKVINIIPYNSLMKEITILRYAMIAFSCIIIVLAILLSALISDKITRPLRALKDAMSRVQHGDLDAHFYNEDLEEVKTLSVGFNGMLDEINKLIGNLLKEEKEKREALLYSLQAQINPHFLYNTLNSVRCLARRYHAEDIRETISALINLLRESISNPVELVTIEKELENARSYMKIQQYRYCDNFKVVYSVDESVLKALVPKLIIQPIIENAIFHGIEPKGEPGTLRIIAERDYRSIIIRIIDDGVGIKRGYKLLSEHKQSGESYLKNIGVSNVDKRIKIYFGQDYGVEIFSLWGCGTSVTIRIPEESIVDKGGQDAESTDC